MVRIRMTRMGKRNRPFYRIGVFDARTRRDGRFIEIVGYYDPFGKDPESTFRIDLDRVRHWLSVGAQPSKNVDVLLKKAGLDRAPRKAKKKRKRPVAGKTVKK